MIWFKILIVHDDVLLTRWTSKHFVVVFSQADHGDHPQKQSTNPRQNSWGAYPPHDWHRWDGLECIAKAEIWFRMFYCIQMEKWDGYFKKIQVEFQKFQDVLSGESSNFQDVLWYPHGIPELPGGSRCFEKSCAMWTWLKLCCTEFFVVVNSSSGIAGNRHATVGST